MFTSELREVPLVCDRVLVMHDGRIVDEMPAGDADEERLLAAAHGRTVEMFTPEVQGEGDDATLTFPEALRALVASRSS